MDFNQEKTIFSVTELNNIVKDVIENSFMPFTVQGEISSLLIHRSGHVYFNLKDNQSQIKATFFNGAKTANAMDLKNGDLIEAFGNLSVYTVRGEYQFNIRKLSPLGLGYMQQKFEEIKKRLQAEGLFDESRKKPIPKLPKSIGVISSSSGAAIRDFLQIIERRFPNMHVKIYPAQVQGSAASLDVAKGIAFFNRTKSADVIVITRGGGSMEDLWAFNDENLARVITKSRIPIISAVGHEIDFTICDFVADLRVPTPSAAAELVVNRQLDMQQEFTQISKNMKNLLDFRYLSLQNALSKIENSKIFRNTAFIIENYQQQLDELSMRITNSYERNFTRTQSQLELLEHKLNDLNPASQLRRGYAMLFDDQNKLIKSSNIPSKSKLKAQLQDGAINLTVD